MYKFVSLLLALFLAACAGTPTVERSEATLDSSRPLTEGLKSYDVEYYVLRNNVLVDRKAIGGSATIRFRALQAMEILELDFDGAYVIENIQSGGAPLEYRRDPAKLFVALGREMPSGEVAEVTVEYHGKPVEAAMAPWEGGFVWSETPSGKPWIATAMQGEGCDIWWPCKDHPTGEPDGMDLYFTVPKELTAVANGVLVSVDEHDNGTHTFHWRTEVPVNTYGVALNVAPYVLIEDTYRSSNGTVMPVMFWAIEDHEDQARTLFEREFAATIEFFERKVGPYPWGQEKLGVAETPHLGMEHQTVNAYGNKFGRGDYGYDWLFHHELAHEWFGNVMTHATVSDMWLHEGFSAFMQPEYAREVMGDAAFYASMYATYRDIKACNPMAPREEFSADELYFDDAGGRGPAGDIYTKGTWLLHSLRYVVGDDAFWRSVRRLVYDTPDPTNLVPPIPARLRSTDDFVRIVSEESGEDLGWFFEVYARRGPLPELDIEDTDAGVALTWRNTGDIVFPMPVPVRVEGQLRRVEFTGSAAVLPELAAGDIQVDPFMQVLRKLPVVPTCEERREAAAESPHH